MRALLLILAIAVAGCAASEEPSVSPTPPAPSPTLAFPSATESPTPSPEPTPSPSPQSVGTYLALGDSLAVGVGATRPGEAGYVGRLHALLGAPDSTPRTTALHNLAVSGETSTSMIRDGQLAAAVDAMAAADPAVVLVTLDIGGNDLLALLRTEACAANPQGADCMGLVALTLEDFEANYRLILEELTAALEPIPNARLAVMTYFNPFSGTDAAYEAAAELALLGVDGRLDCDAVDPRARGMNDVIACVGRDLGVIPVDVMPEFEGLGLELTHIGAQDIHANDRGYELIADLFERALRP